MMKTNSEKFGKNRNKLIEERVQRKKKINN